MHDTTLTIQSTVRAVSEQVWCELSDEVVVLSLMDGCYYGLSRVAAAVWCRIQEPTTVAEIMEGLIGEYDVSPERCTRDVLALLEDLTVRGLVIVSPADRGSAGADIPDHHGSDEWT